MSNESIQISEGYRFSKLGWIPKEWTVVKFSDFSVVVMGQSPDGDTYNKEGKGVPLLNGPTEFTDRFPIKIQWTIKPTKICKEGDILLCVRGSSTGRINIANDTYCIGRGIAAIRSRENSITGFVEYSLQKIVAQILKLTTGSTFPNIDSQSLKKILFPLPSLPEQQKIAQILQTWDKAIDKTEQLIVKKQELKKGLMQQLLTGKVRFREFVRSERMKETKFGWIPEDWEVYKIHKVFVFISTNSFSREQMHYEHHQDSIFNIHYGDIHATYKQPILDFEKNHKSVPVLKGINTYTNGFLQNGDLIIADASEDYEGVGCCIELINIGTRKVLGGLHTLAARDCTNLTADGFRSYILKNPYIFNELKKIATGSKVFGISKKNITDLDIILPNKEEQQKIASVLSSVDKEIDKLQQQLEMLKEQKKALMQKLLTGQIRVKFILNLAE